MADSNRKTVDTLVLHHAVTPLWDDKSKTWLINWFSDNGFARAYGSNPANWSGLYKPNGQRSYSQAHYAGQRVTSKTPDATTAERNAGYRLVQLVKDPFGVITWHAGNWATNCRSIGIENLGDYRNYTLRDGDCKVIADFWRPQDTKLKGNTSIVGHKEVSDASTSCPARIMEKRNTIVAYVNTKPPVKKPVPQAVKLPTVLKFTAKLNPTNVWDLETNPNYKATTTLKKGASFDAYAKIAFNGATYYVTKYSYDKKKKVGVNSIDLIAVTPKPVEPKPVEPKPPAPTNSDVLKENNSLLKQILTILKKIFNLGE